MVIPAELPTRKNELVKLCRDHQLDHTGTVKELTERLAEARDTIPDVLPKTKAALVELCRLHGLEVAGTVKELAERLEKERDGEDDDDDGDEGDEAGPGNERERREDEDLATLTPKQLREICSKLKISQVGNSAALIARITKLRAEKQQRAIVTDGWEATLKLYCPRLKYENIIFDWGTAASQLSPAVWPVIFSPHPLDRAQVYGPVNTDGPMTMALLFRWKSLLLCEEKELQAIRRAWVTMYNLVRCRDTLREPEGPQEWAREHWDAHVQPAIRLLRVLQAKALRKKGLGKVAARVTALARIPLESMGYDVAELAEKSIGGKIADNLDLDAADDDLGEDDFEDTSGGTDGRSRKRRRGKAGKGVCRKCGVKATPSSGQSNRDWFAIHNKTCK